MIQQLWENKYLAAGIYFMPLESKAYCFSMKTYQKHWVLFVYLVLLLCCHMCYSFLYLGLGVA